MSLCLYLLPAMSPVLSITLKLVIGVFVYGCAVFILDVGDTRKVSKKLFFRILTRFPKKWIPSFLKSSENQGSKHYSESKEENTVFNQNSEANIRENSSVKTGH
jgi:hypothetical protein